MKSLGKINKQGVNQLFDGKLGKPNDKILQGSAFGVDLGIIKISNQQSLITASDPASFIPSLGIKESAWLTVILTANDITTSGFLPQYAQFILNLTHKMSNQELTSYWEYIHQFCSDIGISIAGGHTGFDNIGNSTLAGGTTMFAIVDTANIKCSAFAKPNQDLILTKTAALSSGTILAKSFPNHTKKHLGQATYTELAASFYQTSILEEVKVLQKEKDLFQGITAMHDVTEGGVLGAIYELCEASGVGAKIDKNEIPISQAQRELCKLFQINPLRLSGAGSLLIACQKEVSKSIVDTLEKNDIKGKIVGETLPLEKGRTVFNVNEEKELSYWEKDPYWDAFFKAIDKKLD